MFSILRNTVANPYNAAYRKLQSKMCNVKSLSVCDCNSKTACVGYCNQLQLQNSEIELITCVLTVVSMPSCSFIAS